MYYLEDISKEYEDIIENYSIYPDEEKFPKYKKGEFIDKNKSVIWNEEEVERRNQAYVEEQKRLRKVKNDAENKVIEKIKQYIIQETGLSIEKAGILWSFTFREHHAFMSDVWNYLDEYIDLYNDLKA